MINYLNCFTTFKTSIYSRVLLSQHSIHYSHIMISSYFSSCLCQCYESMFDSLFEIAIFINAQDLYELHAKFAWMRNCSWFLRAQEVVQCWSFACKRCFVRFSSNIKLHKHIRNHHAKSVVSSFTSSSTSSELIIFLDDISKFSQSKILSFTLSISIFSSFFTSKFLSLSNFASEFVFKRSESASLTSSVSSSQKFASVRSTSLSKSYLIIDDLFKMFVEKLKRTKSFVIQQSLLSSDVSVVRQARIISYFLSISKSTKIEVFSSVHDSMKQSIRSSFSRFSIRSSSYFSSTQFSFWTNFYFSFVCWRCQESFVICLSRNWVDFIATRVEISVRRRERRLFL